jgi:hypothetical protein
MPKANDSTATKVTNGDLKSVRRASFRLAMETFLVGTRFVHVVCVRHPVDQDGLHDTAGEATWPRRPRRTIHYGAISIRDSASTRA